MEKKSYISRPKVVEAVEVTSENLMSLANEVAHSIVFEGGMPCMIILKENTSLKACVGDFLVIHEGDIEVESSLTMNQKYVDISEVEPPITNFIEAESYWAQETDDITDLGERDDEAP